MAVTLGFVAQIAIQLLARREAKRTAEAAAGEVRAVKVTLAETASASMLSMQNIASGNSAKIDELAKATVAAVKADTVATSAVHDDVKAIAETVNGARAAMLEKIASLERLVAQQAAALCARDKT